VVGVLGELVVGDEVPGYGFAIVGTKELSGRVPELSRFIGSGGIQFVFEFGVSLSEQPVELGLVFDAVEDEWLSRREDYYLLGEVAV
jgi:hypothetical protein